MSETQRWARVEALFDEAVDLDPEARRALISERAGSDTRLRDEVLSLLAASDRETGPLERDPGLVGRELLVGAATAPADHLEPGQVVGPYRIVRLIGRGGMGSVWLAERADGQFEKEVALKLVQAAVPSDELLDRFRRERQILARLEHPGIAALLDGGVTDEGLPYLVMEMVRGVPIDVYCDERRLSVRERIVLFGAVCDAVAYAHRALVVHRDLKPSNILVTDRGRVKLLDFGIAKVVSPAGDEVGPVTRVPHLTPEYAAPEQIAGDPTTTGVDVYGLGLVLYELLVGSPAHEFATRSIGEFHRVICAVAPRAPSQVLTNLDNSKSDQVIGEIVDRRRTDVRNLQATLQGDLDLIVMRALEKPVERRYESAGALADDLRFWLDGRPIRARPDSVFYRMGRFVRRNVVGVGLASATALALVLGMIATTWQARVASLERDRRVAEATRAEAARDFLLQLLGQFDPDELQARGGLLPEDVVRIGLSLLDTARTAGRRLAEEPDLQAGVLNTLGRVSFNLGEYDQARALHARALALATLGAVSAPGGSRSGDPEADPEALAEALAEAVAAGSDPGGTDRGDAMLGISRSYLLMAQADSATAWGTRAVASRRAALPEGDPRIGEALVQVGWAHFVAGRIDAAEVVLDSASAYGDLDPVVDARRFETLGDIRLRQGRLGESAQAYQTAIRIREGALGAGHPDVARSLLGLGRVLRDEGDFDAARAALTRAVSIFRASYGSVHEMLGIAYYELGNLERTAAITLSTGPDGARSVRRAEVDAFTAAESALPEGSPWGGFAAIALARASADVGQDEAAAEWYAEGVLRYQAAGIDRGLLQDARDRLAHTWIRLGRLDDAAVALEESVRAWTGPLDDAERAVRSADALGDLYRRLGRAAEAERTRAVADSLRGG